MFEDKTNGQTKFFAFGAVLSLVLHATCAIAFIMPSAVPPPDEAEPLIIELQGDISDTQVEHRAMQAIKGVGKGSETQEADPVHKETEKQQDTPNVPPQEDVESEKATPAPSSTPTSTPAETANSGESSPNTIVGTQTQQNAQTIKAKQDENDRVRDYARRLGKKIQSSLPAEKRRASVTISFAIRGDGHVRQDTLKVVQSSGQSALDESALSTVRAGAPYDPPPREMTVKMVVDFDRRR